MKYRQRSMIEASQWYNDSPDMERFRNSQLSGSETCSRCGLFFRDHGWLDRIVCPGDWIVTRSDGTHYSLHDAEFKALYEPATRALEMVQHDAESFRKAAEIHAAAIGTDLEGCRYRMDAAMSYAISFALSNLAKDMEADHG